MKEKHKKSATPETIAHRTNIANEIEKEDDGDVGPEARTRAWVELRNATSNGHKKHDPNSYVKSLHAWRALRAYNSVRGSRRFDGPIAPVPPPATNWIPIGPSVVRRGQAGGAPPVSGRTVDVAIAPGGTRVYAATANGGLWRSDDSGKTWRSLMDNVDLAPTFVDADSLACGAVAMNPSSPDRIYLGTGEGESSTFFFNAFGPLGVVYSYAGVGPLRNDMGGDGPWITESIATGSPSLVGQAFYALAVDPADAERVVGATTAGIYRREPDGAGGYQWRQTRAGNCTNVVVALSAGVTTWYAAMMGGTMLTSSDGAAWTAVGTGYPTSVSRVSLAVQPTNPNTIYAFSSAGVHRLDISNGTWRVVTSTVNVDSGNYCAAIAVDPVDVTRIFIGAYGGGPGGGARIIRGVVSSSGSGTTLTYSMASTAIGSDVHPDVHRVVVRADAATEMWVACDGGVFRTVDADGTAAFQATNVDLATMTCTYLDNHPTEAAVVFCGAQDNGTLRYTGEDAWLHSADGDGGPVVINWNDPYKIVRTYVYGAINRATDGGAGPGSWGSISPPSSGALFYPPLVGTPYEPSTPAHADRIATGADRTWFSDNFGTSWSTPDTSALTGVVSALVFATADRVYAGTTTGRVYSYTRSGSNWSAGTLVGQVGGTGITGLAPIVTDIVADPADASGASFYVTLGGNGDWRRVWHYNGTSWSAASGPSAGATTSLLAVHFNALAADPMNTSNLFAGADIGIWRSVDGGANWTPYAEGLPEAGVSDLKLHPTRRLLRAATYGRGAYERDIDATSAAGIELYARDTSLDVARWATVDWLADPESATTPHALVRHWESPNIKVDPPASNGTYQATKQIDFFQFVDRIVDGSEGVATIDSSLGTAVNRVYVEVHNRGVTSADGVQVMLLMANASAGLLGTPLPSGYAANVQSGMPISTASWQTVGIKTLDGLRVGIPQVIEFDLPSTMLPPPTSLPAQSHYCLLALLHHAADQFNNTETNADNLTIADRKVAQKNLQIVNFTGTLPPPNSPSLPLASMSSLIALYASERSVDLVLDTTLLKGNVLVVLPKGTHSDEWEKSLIGGTLLKPGQLDGTVKEQIEVVKHLLAESRTTAQLAHSAIRDLQGCVGGTPVRFAAAQKRKLVGVRNLLFSKPTRALLVFEPPEDARLGDQWQLPVMLVTRGRIAGGSTYSCRVVLPADDERKIQINAHLTAGRRLYSKSRLHVSLTSAGKAIDGSRDNVEVYVAAFTALGMQQPVKELTWDPERAEFALDVHHQGEEAVIRRMTVIARRGKLEGRKTIDTGFFAALRNVQSRRAESETVTSVTAA